MKLKTLLVLGVAVFMTISVASAADVFFRYDKNGWEKGFQGLAAGIKANAGLTPILQLQSPPDQYAAFIQTAIVGNSTPEFFTWWNGTQLEALAATGKIADLSDAWDQAIAAGYFTEGDRDQVSVNGVPYAIPLNVARYPVLYSKAVFKAAGVERPPRTWEELIETAEKLKAAGYVPFTAPEGGTWASSVWFSELMIRIDPEAFVGLGTGATPYNGPEARAALDILSDFFSKGYFTDPREPDGTRSFGGGQSAMWLMGEWIVAALKNSGMEPGRDIGAFIMPRTRPDVEDSIIVETAVVVVSKKLFEKNPTAAAAAVNYLLSPEASNAMSVYNGNLKAMRPHAVVQEVDDLIAAQHPRIVMRWWEAVPSDLQGDLMSQLGTFVLNPTAATAQRVLNTMESFNAEYWSQKR